MKQYITPVARITALTVRTDIYSGSVDLPFSDIPTPDLSPVEAKRQTDGWQVFGTEWDAD